MVLPYDNMDYGEDQVGARNIPELTDVELINLANGEILKYNSSINKWENQPESGGSSESIDSLTDTNITAPIINGSTLVYNTINGKWENAVLVDLDSLNNLSDTNISSLTDKDFLLYDNTSSKWINTPSIIDNLKNVNILSVANNEILKYNSISSKWENTNLNLNEIQDVNITSLQNGEVLKYNSTSGKWENQDNTDTLNELSDVNFVILLNNFVLKYDIYNNEWYGNFVNLTELGDTNISTLNNGDILRYNSVSQKWETDTFNIDDLDNVNINSVANNEVLKYNSTSGKWENSNRIDSLNELGDVTLTSVASNDLLRYNGSVWENTKIALDNDFTNVNFTSLTNGDLIKYDSSNFINFSPTYLDGAGISDNYLIKVVGGATTQTSITETNTVNSTNITFNNGSIETEIFNTTKKRMHLTTDGIASTNGITITSDGRVGIGVVEPDEVLQIDGNLRIENDNIQTLTFYDTHGGSTKEHARIEVDDDGGGADILFYTRPSGGTAPTEKLRINKNGAIGIGGANYGTTNQVLISNDSGSPPTWSSAIDNIIIGANTPAAGSFTTLNVSAAGCQIGPLSGGAIQLAKLYVTGEGVSTGYRGTLNISAYNEGFGPGQIKFFTQRNNGVPNNPTLAMTIDQNQNVIIAGGITASGTIYAYKLEGPVDVFVSTNTGNKMHFTNYFTYSYSHFLPAYYGARDLGSTSYRWRTLYATTSLNTSDDRLKINERPITDALSLISKLNYYEYERVTTLNGSDVEGTDRGVIAQEMLDTDLAFAVKGGGMENIEKRDDEGNVTKENVEVPYSVNYNALLATAMQAIKDLSFKVTALEEKLDSAGL